MIGNSTPSTSVDAPRANTDHERKLRALDRLIADYEAAHGEITEQEMADAVRSVQAEATVVRGARLPMAGC